jgi:hypothetical protein
MARTALTLTQVTRAAAGVAQPAQANSDVVNGNAVPAGDHGRLLIEIQNSNAASRTATFAQPGLVDGVATAGKVITVAGLATVVVGPFPPGVYDQADGTINVDSSGAAGDLKFRCYQLS